MQLYECEGSMCVFRIATTLLTPLTECFLVNAVTSNGLSNKSVVIVPYTRNHRADETRVLEDCEPSLIQICF